jgi:pimeloyl-ACP methyl ester carboxylesterase
MRPCLCSNRFPWLPLLIAILAALSSGAEDQREEVPSTSATFAVEIHGEGQPVFLIPGLGSSASVWEATVETLVAEGYQAHVFTLAGFAGQPPLPPGGDDYLTAVGEALVAYARTLPEPPALVGHSLGGTVSLALAAGHPDLFGPVVAVDGVAFLPALMNPEATEASAGAMARQMTANFQGMSQAAYDTQAAMTFASMITDPAIARQVAEASRGTDPATAAAAMYALMSRDLRDDLGTIRAPVLLLAAGAVAPTPEAAVLLRQRYESQVAAVPEHRVEVVEGARHFIMLDQPGRFLELLLGHLREHARRGPEQEARR